MRKGYGFEVGSRGSAVESPRVFLGFSRVPSGSLGLLWFSKKPSPVCWTPTLPRGQAKQIHSSPDGRSISMA